MSGIKYLHIGLLFLVSIFGPFSVSAQVNPDLDLIRKEKSRFNVNFQRYPQIFKIKHLLLDSNGRKTAESSKCVEEISSVHFQGNLLQLKRNYKIDSSIFSITLFFVDQKLALVSQQQLIFPSYYNVQDQLSDNLYHVPFRKEYFIKHDSIINSTVTGLQIGKFIFGKSMTEFDLLKNQILATLNSID